MKNSPIKGKILKYLVNEKVKKVTMKHVKNFENKKVLVLGLARSGEAAARLLAKLGAIVTVNDGKPFDENPSAQALLEECIKVICGSHPL